MAEEEVKDLQKILEDQRILIQKLQVELDEERKAAASGAEEALSMILRLQQEKSTQSMESLQYRRIIEEKLRHDEEALAVMREIVFLKDTEIEAVRYQLGVFRSKLLSLCVDGGSFSWFNRYEFGKNEHLNLGRRNISLPSVRLEELCSEIDGLKYGNVNVGSFFDDCEKKCTKENNERKYDNLFRSKSSMKEISGASNGFRAEAYNSEADFLSPIKLNCANIPPAPQKKLPRRTSSVILLDSCIETEPVGTSLDKFEVPESLSREKECNSNFGHEKKRVEKSIKDPDLEDFAVTMRCVENEIRKMTESNSAASNKQLELLVEIRDKITVLESHIQQRDDDDDDDHVREESSERQRQMKAGCTIRLQQPSGNQTEESLLSYYIEAMLSWYM